MSLSHSSTPRPERSRSLALAIAAVLATGQGVARAQESTDGLEEVIVSATRRQESIQDIPFNIAAASGEQLQQQGITDLVGLTGTVPGIFLVDQGPRADNLITVRGLNASYLQDSELTGNSGGGTVATYVGDIPLYVDLKLFDMERVEVLLGPQGTLYGAGTLGGAIRYLTNQPDPTRTTLDISGDIYALSESEGTGATGTAVFNLPLVSDVLALRVGIDYTDDPGFIDYDYLVREAGVSNPQPDFSDPADVAANLWSQEDADDEQTLAARAALYWRIGDRVDATLTYYYQDQEVGARTVNHDESFGTGRYVSGHRFLEPNDVENQLLSLEVNVDLGFAQLTSATGASRFEQLGQRDQTDLLLDFMYGYEEFPSFAAYTREIVEEKTLNQELRLVSQSDGPLSWIAGAFYNRFEEEGSSEEFTPGYPEFIGVDRPDNLEYLSVEDSEFTEKALFGEIGYQITDAWQVIIGGRWFDTETDQSLGVDFPLFNDAPDEISPDFEHNVISDDGVIGKFNTSYRFTDDVMGYFTISEGYRTGGVNAVQQCQDPLPPNQTVCAQPDELLIKPETTTNYEIGLRNSWLGGRVVFNAAVYYIDWKDVQVSSRTQVGGQPITVNGATAESTGLELALRGQLTENWLIEAGYSYNKAELTEDAPGIVDEDDSDPTSPTYGGARDGDRLPGSPEHKGSFTLSYFQPMGDLDLRADYGIVAISDVYSRAGLRNGGEALPGFALHRAALGLAGDAWSVRLHVDNLFNKYAETSVRATRDYIRTLGSNDFALRSYYKGMARPRTIGIDFSYSFDL